MIHVFYHHHRHGHDIFLVRGELPTIEQLVERLAIDFEPKYEDEYIEHEGSYLEGDLEVFGGG